MITPPLTLLARAILLSLSLSIIGCTHVARMEDLPKSAAQAPFESASRPVPRNDAVWMQQTRFEHYIELAPMPIDALRAQLEAAFRRAGYEVTRSDPARSAIFGTRGLTMLEWGSVSALYYRAESDRIRVLVMVHVTQDVTGSPQHNPAAKVGNEICRDVGFCQLRN